ncbi:hypothetical protein GCM10017044_17880 [Kordiimonas sediminis]|uniref:Porin n=1 Tax=Kordiimonas sediminis TaxID=1735581 RepID=A0A919AU74_9PROT|nr:porin [Kordiimonas sediminis]GHF23735.1 hypothetical protein GCM10017044_17880 [Kordiimonas sediminis]
MTKKKFLISLMTATALVVPTMPASAQSIDELKAQLALLAKRIEELEAKQATNEAAIKEVQVGEARMAAAQTPSSTSPAKVEKKVESSTFTVTGRVFADMGWVNDGDDTTDLNGTEFRAARIEVGGKVYDSVKYKLGIDVAGDDINITDAYLQYKTQNATTISIGQFKGPNSLEELTSSRYITFMERSSLTDAFDLRRELGISVGRTGDGYTLTAAIMKGEAGSDITVDSDRLTLAARGTYGQATDMGTWLVGASVRYRETDDDGGFRYRQRPHSHIAPRFVNTGTLSDKDFLIGLEGAYQRGSFHVASEYMRLENSNGGTNSRDASFWGGYVEAGWFLTGESKPLDLSKGSWGRPKVKSPIHEGGMGAWQIAARYDVIDLTDNGVFGGEQDTWMLGVNWYLNRNSRIMMNFSHSSIDDAFGVSLNGDDGKNSVDALGLRFQIDW